MTGKSLSVYIHVPFCSRKCPYCHFYVQKGKESEFETFTKRICKEWEDRANLLESGEIVSIYFGGGTPSLLSPLQLEKILKTITKGPFPISSSCEITLEANPEKISQTLMEEIHSAGFNRLSIGVQSFDDAQLKTLGRTHESSQAKEAVYYAQKAGIENITIDLMYELPKQTLATWKKSVDTAASLPISHLSLYNLTFEPGTLFHRKQKELFPSLPSDEEALSMLEYGVEAFEAAGLHRYEISAFAREGYESVHNTGYWTGRPFLGIGPSAFSYIDGRRFQNIPNLKKWGEKVDASVSPESFSEKLPKEQREKELLAVELRLLKGVDLTVRAPFSSSLESSVDRLIKEGLIQRDENTLSLTSLGHRFYDTVGREII